jgi:hypothetical protein
MSTTETFTACAKTLPHAELLHLRRLVKVFTDTHSENGTDWILINRDTIVCTSRQLPHPSEMVCGIYAVHAASGRVLVAEDNATGTPLRWIACVGEFISPPLSAKSPIEALQAEIMALLDVLNETRKLLSLFATYPREFNPRTVVETHAREKNCILLIGALRQSLQAEFFGGAS